MSRFSNLELDGFREGDSESRIRGELDRDEHYYLQRAGEAYRQARFDLALRLYSRTLEFNPNLIEGWIGQVRMLIELGELSEAALWASKALEVFRDEALVLAALAHAHVRLGHTDQAMGYSDAAVHRPAEFEYVWLVRGEVLLAQGRGGLRNADYCFVRALGIGGGDWFLRLLVSRVYFYYKRFAEALDYCNEALEASARNAFAWTVRGQCMAGLGMHRGATRAFEQAVKLDPAFTMARDEKIALSRKGLSWKGVFYRLRHPFGD